MVVRSGAERRGNSEECKGEEFAKSKFEMGAMSYLQLTADAYGSKPDVLVFHRSSGPSRRMLHLGV